MSEHLTVDLCAISGSDELLAPFVGPIDGTLSRSLLTATSASLKVMDLPHSDACFVKAYPAETTEAFCDAHVAAFAFFDGVPTSILYDNTRIAVARILGDGQRKRTRVFSELVSHYLFEDRFGRPGKGNDKGKVEGMVGCQ